MLPDLQGFGQNTYVYERGDRRRFQVGASRTLLPDEGESNEAFARRAQDHVFEALEDPSIAKAIVVEELAAYSVTRYTIMVEAAPRLAPIKRDPRRAGVGRQGLARGVRGGERHRRVLN